MERKNLYILIAFILALAFILIYSAFFGQTTYYTVNDPLGPLSVNPIIFVFELLLPIGFLILLRNGKYSSPWFFIPVVLIVVILYVSFELFDTQYVTSFYDATSHFNRGLYVAVTGHSNPLVDGYFDMQPAFFWVTGIVSSVAGFSLSSSVSAISLLILKWTPLVEVLLYLPILGLFYKKLLGDNKLVATALVLQLSLELLTFHYSAETYGQAIYWLIFCLMFLSSKKLGIKYSILAIFASISLIFVHQGLTILTLIALTSLVIYRLPFKIIDRKLSVIRRGFVVLPVIVGISWVVYLMFATKVQFNVLLSSLSSIIVKYLSQSTAIISLSTFRASELWQTIVYEKSVYILLIMGLGLSFSFYNAYKRKEDSDRLAFTLLLSSIVFFGGASVGLGGAGYLE